MMIYGFFLHKLSRVTTLTPLLSFQKGITTNTSAVPPLSCDDRGPKANPSKKMGTHNKDQQCIFYEFEARVDDSLE